MTNTAKIERSKEIDLPPRKSSTGDAGSTKSAYFAHGLHSGRVLVNSDFSTHITKHAEPGFINVFYRFPCRQGAKKVGKNTVAHFLAEAQIQVRNLRNWQAAVLKKRFLICDSRVAPDRPNRIEKKDRPR
jgi:hypothetical protein